jgi:L-cysteine desulfidase
MKISQDTAVSMPVKNMIGIVMAVAMGVFAYTEVTSRLTSLETSRELMNSDLLKKSEQTTTDSEQFMLLEDLYKSTEKLETRIDNMMHNKINIEFLKKQTEKLLEDVEKLKDKVRQNGNGTH